MFTQKPNPKRRKRVLKSEILESRKLFAVTPYPMTDMTQMAAFYGQQSGKTLYVNFDGRNANSVDSTVVSRFTGSSQDVHDILFRTSQIFAPFDVKVERAFGRGNQGRMGVGNSTIFVGDTDSGGTAKAWTPWSSADWPGPKTGYFKTPDSNADDIAFVDPIWLNSGIASVASNQWIAQAVAHEAGHTFGLGHVLASPSNDMMSYNSANSAFLNKTFSLTDQNNNGAGGVYSESGMRVTNLWFTPFLFPVPMEVTSQNSYTYLRARLGGRSTSGDIANVADRSTVDGGYRDANAASIGYHDVYHSGIDRKGDFDVFSFRAGFSGGIQIDVKNQGEFAHSVDPVVLVYDSSGQRLLSFNDDGGSYRDSRLTLDFRAGQSYKIVVGSYGNHSTGQYQLRTTALYAYGGSSTWSASAQQSTGASFASYAAPAPNDVTPMMGTSYALAFAGADADTGSFLSQVELAMNSQHSFIDSFDVGDTESQTYLSGDLIDPNWGRQIDSVLSDDFAFVDQFA